MSTQGAFGAGGTIPRRSVTFGPSGTGAEVELGAERQLCFGILLQAFEDWQNVRAGTPTVLAQELAGELGFPGSREELTAFFESDWLAGLCTICDLPIDKYLGALGREAQAES